MVVVKKAGRRLGGCARRQDRTLWRHASGMGCQKGIKRTKLGRRYGRSRTATRREGASSWHQVHSVS